MRKIDISKADKAVEEYCAKNGADFAKLKEAYKQMLSGVLCYALFPDVEPNGLKNDLDTQAIPILFVRENLTVEKADGFHLIMQ